MSEEIRGDSGLLLEEETFVHEWITGGYGKGGPAYLKVHPNAPKATAGAKAKELLEAPLIKAYACGVVKAHLDKYNVTEESIIAELSYIAFLDIADLMLEDGSLIPKAHEMPEEARRAISSISSDAAGKITIKVCSKEKALQLLAQYKKLLTEMHVVTTDQDLAAEILAARKRTTTTVETKTEESYLD